MIRMSTCIQSNCGCNSCRDESDATVQIEHNIRVTHVQQKVVHLEAPRKSSSKVVSKAGDCLNDPEGCSLEDVKSMAGSILSVSQGHDDPVFESGGTFVEEFILDDYDDDEESWEDYTVVTCDCGNLAAKDCDNNLCGNCCSGCSRHG